MPWRLISFIICLILITIFAGFNLDNKCDISFGFFVLNDIPIFLSLMASFLAGIIITLPFTFKKRYKDRQQTAAHGVAIKNPAASAKKTAAQPSAAKPQAVSKQDAIKTAASVQNSGGHADV